MENNQKKMTPKMMEERQIIFASRIIDMVESLPQKQTARHLGGQILRSGTAPALNYGEAQAAESREDFIHKMKICLKELRETLVCLKLIEKRNWFSESKLTSLVTENDELVSIFVTSAKTAGGRKHL